MDLPASLSDHHLPKLRELLDAKILGPEHSEELKHALSFYDAHRERVPFQPGDRVALVDDFSVDFTASWGWRASRFMLVPGNTATVYSLKWSTSSHDWIIMIGFEAEFSCSEWGDGVSRFYCSATTKRSLFMMRPSDLRPARADDRPSLPPSGGTYYLDGSREVVTHDEACTILLDRQEERV